MKRRLFYLSLGLSLSFGSIAFAQNFERDLYFGMQNNSEVTRLQEFLTGQGIYKGPVTGNFFSLTLGAVKQFQGQNGISPASGYFGPKTRAAANLKSLALLPAAPVSLQEQIAKLLKQVEELQKQLAALPAVPVQTIPEVVATSSPAVVLPLDSSLKINITYPNYTLYTYGKVTLNTFELQTDEKIAITRIKFKDNGSFAPGSNFYGYLSNFELIDSITGTVLATVPNFDNKGVEFKLSSPMISGGNYTVKVTMITPGRSDPVPKIRLDIESPDDISAFDFNDLTRKAIITKNNSFPIIGPTISAF